ACLSQLPLGTLAEKKGVAGSVGHGGDLDGSLRWCAAAIKRSAAPTAARVREHALHRGKHRLVDVVRHERPADPSIARVTNADGRSIPAGTLLEEAKPLDYCIAGTPQQGDSDARKRAVTVLVNPELDIHRVIDSILFGVEQKRPELAPAVMVAGGQTTAR